MSKTELLKELELIKFPLSASRYNTMRNNIANRGFVLGKVRNRGRGLWKDKRVIRDSRKNDDPKYSKIYELAKAVIKKSKPDFKYNTIQFNKNARMAKHIDGYNVGISTMLGLGDYTGGDLIIYDEKGKNPKKVETKNKWVTFNGSKLPHETDKFKGTRYTLVFFNTEFH
tara:strand:+ start:775 stop:1284 length:510 start_codon:yes stop_codon:yes gene_type:complete